LGLQRRWGAGQAPGSAADDVGSMGVERAGQRPKKGEDPAAEAPSKISFPEVLVRWCRPDPPMRGTPPQPDGAQSGSIRLLGKPMDRGRQLREERRRQRKANSRGGAAGDRGGSDAGLVRVEAVMAMFRDQGSDVPLREERPGRVPPSARASLLLPRDASAVHRQVSTEEDEDDAEHAAAASEDPHQLAAATWETAVFEVVQPAQSEGAAAKLGIAEARSVATQVRAQAARITSEAWATLKQEFEVQCQVWESAALLAAARNKGKIEELEKRPEAQLRAKLEALLLESADVGSSASSDAIKTFAATVREDAQQGRHLSKSVASASAEAERAQPLSEARHSLSRHLEAVAAGSSSTQLEAARREDLEMLVSTCRLEDTRVEYCTRRVLGLSMFVGSVDMGGDRCKWADVGDDVREGFLSGSWGSQSTEPWAA